MEAGRAKRIRRTVCHDPCGADSGAPAARVPLKQLTCSQQEKHVPDPCNSKVRDSWTALKLVHAMPQAAERDHRVQSDSLPAVTQQVTCGTATSDQAACAVLTTLLPSVTSAGGTPCICFGHLCRVNDRALSHAIVKHLYPQIWRV